MGHSEEAAKLFNTYLKEGDHTKSDYFSLIKQLVSRRNVDSEGEWQGLIDQVYQFVLDEMIFNTGQPTELITFGTSGWRGRLGKDVYLASVSCVTSAIVEMYQTMGDSAELPSLLGVDNLEQAKQRGCVLGYDNRFGGHLLATAVAKVLSDAGFAVHFAGESTTGVLSASVLELEAAFSINLTPSHNPLEYGGYKFNAADAGPAAAEVTGTITRLAREKMIRGYSCAGGEIADIDPLSLPGVVPVDSLGCWRNLVRSNQELHGLDLDGVMENLDNNNEMVLAIDSVHGASRLHMRKLLPEIGARLVTLRDSTDVTFGGIAPEPSSANMAGVGDVLSSRPEKFKLGAIIDPDGDRIRFTDGTTEISMNQFGAMAYHYLYTYKKKRGMVAKTVATSNLANRLAEALGEELYEPRVGFKEFKPVIGRALVLFEESDGISIIGHTPEKDAYIGLILAIDMVQQTGLNLGDYQRQIEQEFGAYYPDRDGVTVSFRGPELLNKLKGLEQYDEGSYIQVGEQKKKIVSVITIDGRKMIFDDGSWLMIRPSGTEPKVRFYVESRTKDGTAELVATARRLLQDLGVV